MTTMQDAPRYASPADFEAYGEYGAYGPGRGFERGQSTRPGGSPSSRCPPTGTSRTTARL
jgi:hypothetical protein